MAPSNVAAVLQSKSGPITVGPVDYPTLQPGGVLIRNTVIAFNPIEWKIARLGYFPIEYPAILGFSYGGVVEAVDEAVERVKKGDFVFTQNSGKGGAYQRFSASQESFVGKIDEKHVEEAAAVLLNLRTIIGAAVHAGLDRPKEPASSNPSHGKKALVYGGSSSLGYLAAQYLKQAGYEVVTTSSPKNTERVSSTGATVVDHTQPAEEVISQLKQHGPYDFAFDSISTPPATAINAAVLEAQSGDINLYAVGPPPPEIDLPKNVKREYTSWPAHLATADPAYDEWVYTKYIPEAIAAGTLKSVPIEVVKGGLGAVDEALTKLQKGVSAAKLVVYPWEDAEKTEL